jgi:acyl-coenzyme A synthetase/AMP-(fatty) acid ligase
VYRAQPVKKQGFNANSNSGGIEYCREHMSPIKCPKTFDFIEALPRHATGKLYKQLLKDH